MMNSESRKRKEERNQKHTWHLAFSEDQGHTMLAALRDLKGVRIAMDENFIDIDELCFEIQKAMLF